MGQAIFCITRPIHKGIMEEPTSRFITLLSFLLILIILGYFIPTDKHGLWPRTVGHFMIMVMALLTAVGFILHLLS